MGGVSVPRFSSYPNYIVDTVLAFLLMIVAQSYWAVCWTLLYFDTRIRKEGFDLELAAQEQMKP